MNIISCGEDCRYQIDGCCTRSDLIVNGAGDPAAYGDHSDVSTSTNSKSSCCYFEQR